MGKLQHRTTMGKRSLDLCTLPLRRRSASTSLSALSRAPTLLHGCEMPWVLPHHPCFQPRTDCRVLQCMLHCSVPAHWRSLPSHRGLLVPQEGGCLNNSHNCAERREVV